MNEYKFLTVVLVMLVGIVISYRSGKNEGFLSGFSAGEVFGMRNALKSKTKPKIVIVRPPCEDISIHFKTDYDSI